MGALHEGHLALIRQARQLAGRSGTVAVSIFVNPTQFGPKEDLTRYPRPREKDTRLCRDSGVDLLFAPAPGDMYSEIYSTYVEETSLSTVLCGASRPGHFRGVCTVVTKLFHILAPDVAVFGTKDYQQLAIIKQMVRDLNFPVKIAAVETVREPDGLALSSRNQFLSIDERTQAPVIRQALLEAARTARSGETRATTLRQLIKRRISKAPLATIDYIELVDADSLQPVSDAGKNTVIAAAVFFGKTRLIDNISLRNRPTTPPTSKPPRAASHRKARPSLTTL